MVFIIAEKAFLPEKEVSITNNTKGGASLQTGAPLFDFWIFGRDTQKL